MNSVSVKILAVIALIVFSTFSLFVWNNFPLYWMQLLKVQRDVVDSLSEYLVLISQGEQRFGWYILAFSLIYGLLHSVSPGHGKTAITSMALINNYRRRKAVILVGVIASLQAISACLLFAASSALTELFSLSITDNVRMLTQGCGILIIALGGKELIELGIHQLKARRVSRDDNDGQKADTQKVTWGALLLIGLRPCTGAILVLFLASMLGSLSWGLFSTFAMALGTAITNSVLVFNALTIQNKFNRVRSNKHHWVGKISTVFLSFAMMFSGFILFSFANLSGLQSFIR
ncbi:nickel transporter [Vibrio hannami]|uniref:nickel/cobalt transporter n=1 Tax=Vibrio hannami TaxID=2717094 RepID=UPI00240EE2AD|nr:nickel transporter [Vibrio hannami]MDG3087910.1 nickel transporter [Vibrio hannami]